ncbi:MAG: transcription-repair coupling factor [Verrucomicrobiae bacterium]|nr:transcription-repair coupling factor [Verrucomicrobiae bacterium]
MDEDAIFGRLAKAPELKSALAALAEGRTLRFPGAAAPARPFLACLFAAATGRVLCVIAPSAREQEHFFSEANALSARFGNLAPPVGLPEPSPRREDGRAPAVIADPETRFERLQALEALADAAPRLVVATAAAAAARLPSPATLRLQKKRWAVGDAPGMERLAAQLAEAGYEAEAQVAARGQFARRGGILDLFSMQAEAPVRVEFDGETILSIRAFDLATQGAISEEAFFEWIPALESEGDATLADHLPADRLLWSEPADSKEAPRLGPVGARDGAEIAALELHAHDFLTTGTADPILLDQRHDLLLRHWRDWAGDDYEVVVFCNNEGEERRLRELVEAAGEEGAALARTARWTRGFLLRGFVWPDAKLAALSDAEVFGRYQTLRALRVQARLRSRVAREAINFSDYAEGDLVVHAQHGVGRCLGTRKVEAGGALQEALTLEYADGALLHVPLEQAHLVGRYVGVGKARPALDTLGGDRWARAAARARQAAEEYAARILRVEAERRARPGHAFAPDTEWQREFEDAFLHEETADQIAAIEDAKRDMESPQPMDRLVCGDVGFGKTEVALRAAFKAVMGGKQVAVLAPTTVLAQQHERTFRERMADYPIRVDLVSRFRTQRRQTQTLRAAAEGAVDILIGTHRLLQPDVRFKNLGLVVVDEEQRFGVNHKERFKEVFRGVDVLTLSATPIPRTLYLALMGARDISTIETPPANRLPVETTIAAYDERLIRDAIARERARGGQVFFLHNRIGTIQKTRDRLAELLPGTRIEIGHGRMPEQQLEEIMLRFVAGEIDVLVATTIIESGLDIPSANTIIIDRADRFGLADLYQLRGRVGRSRMKAYAWLLLPHHLMIEADARRRVSAIRQYRALGAGFKIAMRDLEIRGAGNLLGTEQSGHATAIGFELYCRLLKEAVARLKGEKTAPRLEVRVRLDFLPVAEDAAKGGVGAFLPRAWIPEGRLRLEAYRHLAEAATADELDALANRWKDRFGRLPQPVEWLLARARIRTAAAARGVTAVETEEGKVMLERGGEFIQVGSRFPRLSHAGENGGPGDATRWLSETLAFLESLGIPDPERKPSRTRRNLG